MVNECEFVPAQAYSLFVHQQTIVEQDVLGAVKYIFTVQRVKGKGKFVIPDEDMKAFVLAEFTSQTRQDEWYTGKGPVLDLFQAHVTEKLLPTQHAKMFMQLLRGSRDRGGRC
jgi:hypothetical protein